MATTEYIGTEEAAAKHGVTRTWIKRLAVDGKIPGAIKVNQRAWAIPSDWIPQRQRNQKPDR